MSTQLLIKILKEYKTNAKVVRAMFEGSDHYVVLMKIKVIKKWTFKKLVKEEKQIRSEKPNDEVKKEYNQRMTKEINVAWGTVNKENKDNIFKVFKEKILVVSQVVGTKVVTIRKRKGSAWWTDEVREVITKKRKHI